MPYYLYISDSKVDMLLPQVPRVLRKKKAAELGFDLKLLRGSLSEEYSTLDNRVSRLKTVEAHIDSTEEVGTPAEPASWIRGRVEAVFTGEQRIGTVLFLAEEQKLLLVLAGSHHHLIGNIADVRTESSSFLYRILRDLDRLVAADPPLLVASGQHFRGRTTWYRRIPYLTRMVNDPPQSIEFLAKRLLVNQESGRVNVLATPLYVALAD